MRMRHPRQMAEAEINAYLSHRATEERVSASSQTQAPAALLVLYRGVLESDASNLGGRIRPRSLLRNANGWMTAQTDQGKLLDVNSIKKGGETMHRNLWIIAAALSVESGVFAQENLSLSITTHIQDLGDRKGINSQWLGTTGKRMELINIKKVNGPKNVKIQYRCVIEGSGETAWMDEGQDCGTRGQGKALSAFAVRLAGEGALNDKLVYSCKGTGNFIQISPPHAYCGIKDSSAVNLEALQINVEPTSEDQGYSDDTVWVIPYRLKLANPPKAAFVARIYGDLSQFNIEYQPKDASLPLTKISDLTVGLKDNRRFATPTDKYGYLGDPLGRKDELVSEELVPNTEYIYRLVGKHKDGKEYKSPDLFFKTTPMPGLKMGLLTDEASQYGVSSINFAGAIGKAKEDGVAYIEYGTNPSRLDQRTKEKSFSKGEDAWYAARADSKSVTGVLAEAVSMG